MKYSATIDGGEGGETTILADSAKEALVRAIEWARSGDWPDTGCDIIVSVENDDDADDCLSDDLHILSADEARNETLTEEGEVIGEDEEEFRTHEVIRIGDDYFYRLKNGGSRGAHDPRTNPDVFSVEELSRSEARARLLKFGYSPKDVADATREE